MTPEVKAGRAGGPHRPLDSRESPLGRVPWAACQSRALLPGGLGSQAPEGVRPPSQPHGHMEEPAMSFWAGQAGVCSSAKAAEPLCLEDGVGAAQPVSLFLPTPRDEGGAWTGQPVPHAL